MQLFQYCDIPAKTWSWSGRIASDSEIFAETGSGFLDWHGDCKNPLYGGWYTILRQSYEDFLESGPPAAAEAPEKIRSEIRAHLQKFRTAGLPTRLDISVAADRAVVVERLQVSLDGFLIFTGENPKVNAKMRTLYSGSVPPGKHTVTYACALRQRQTHYKIERFETLTPRVAAGKSALTEILFKNNFPELVPHYELKIKRTVLYTNDDVAGRWYAKGTYRDDAGRFIREEISADHEGGIVRREVVVLGIAVRAITLTYDAAAMDILRATYEGN